MTTPVGLEVCKRKLA